MLSLPNPMKANKTTWGEPLWPVMRSLPCLAALAAAVSASHAADVTLGASNAIGTSSFETATSWSNSAAPSAGNAYFVPTGLTLRTPADSPVNHTFAGDSLKLTGASLVYKGLTNVNTITINNLTLDGSLVNSASNSSSALILAGSITIAGSGTSTIFSNNASVTISAPIAGNSGTLLLQTNATAGRQVILTAANTYHGTIQVTGASGAVLDPGASLAFAIGASGVNNTITGTGAFFFNGSFNIDLTAAGNTIGNSWALVDVTNLVETFGDTFTIPGFTENAGIWTSSSGAYQFNESTGVLSRISTDSDGDGLPDAWEYANFGNGNLSQGGADDPDNDFASNLLEYENGSNPNDAGSYPDTDGDGLNDGWERFYFANSLAQTAEGDPDGDLNSNVAEFAAGTDPGFAGNFPETDGDGINDGWEISYFGSIAACLPDVDADGDFFDNYDEFLFDTNPIVQISSPDSENDFLGDGLPDGWEVKYFGAPGESLEVVIAKQSGTDDPDGDSYDNAAEHSLGTDPTNAASVPGPVAWWRYEEKTSGPVAAGAGGEAEFNNVVLDSSENGNHMRTYNDQTAPEHFADVPFAIIPNGGQPNTASLYFDGATDGSWLDLVYTDTNAPIRSRQFTAWTIEASFKMDGLPGSNSAIFAKDGNPLGGQPPFSLMFRASDQKFEVGMVDGTGTAHYASSLGTIVAGQWYSVAATANDTTLSLWLKGPGDSTYLLQESTAISGAFHNTFTGLNDAWAAGRRRWNGGEADYFKGYLDEVRISAAALPSSQFLASSNSTIVDSDGDGMDDNWELANFGNPPLAETASGDFDKDGTSNLVEYLLGFDPASGSSRFAAARIGEAITWSASSGRVFKVQRSTTLANEVSWTDVATVTATGPSATWTDPSPPTGKAFYRVVLSTN